ncbi:formate acetyltransferase 1, partial [Vibrio parahaemolyticus VP2007-007]|jgi:hypothetical protein
LH